MLSLDSLRGLTWPARHVVRFGAPGAHRSRVRGPAPEFSEYRSFRQGDDPRRLDWKLLARTDRAYLRLTEDRATAGTLIVLDASASMDFPQGPLSKWRWAVELAVGLAQVAHQSGDPVGVFVPGVEGARLPPRTRQGLVSEIKALLETVSPGGTSGVFEIARQRVPPRVVLLSDFLDEEPGQTRAVSAHVGGGGEVHAVRIVAREEVEPSTALFTAVDPERPDVARALGPSTRAIYQQRYGAWAAQVAARWRVAGARWTDAVTDEPALHVIRRIVGEQA